MKYITVVKNRVFTLRDISEKEGLILRTLLNLSTDRIRQVSQQDDGYWNDNITEDEAVEIGIQLRDMIFEMVDEEL